MSELDTPAGCVSVEDLSALVDGELTPAEASRVREHVATCARCAELLARLGGASRVVSAIPREDASDELVRDVARRAMGARSAGGLSRSTRVQLAAAAAVVFAAVLIAIVSNRMPRESARQAAMPAHRVAGSDPAPAQAPAPEPVHEAALPADAVASADTDERRAQNVAPLRKAEAGAMYDAAPKPQAAPPPPPPAELAASMANEPVAKVAAAEDDERSRDVQDAAGLVAEGRLAPPKDETLAQRAAAAPAAPAPAEAKAAREEAESPAGFAAKLDATTTPPILQRHPDPKWPPGSPEDVVVDGVVGIDGRLAIAAFVTPVSADVEAAVRDALAHWRWTPAKAGDRDVAAPQRVTIRRVSSP